MLKEIKIKGARVHNLKNVDLTLPRDTFIVFTGLSGSGKSSLAFDTIYAEGQRRYMESLSSYARQFLDQLDKPDVDHIEGLSPAISIDQKSASQNPRSTVGTVTEIYDYLRLLFSSIGKPFCKKTGETLQQMSVQEMVDDALVRFKDQPSLILAPLIQEKKGEFKSIFDTLVKEGFSRVRVNGEIKRLSDPITLNKNQKHTIDLVIDRLDINEENKSRLFESIELSTKKANGLTKVETTDGSRTHVYSEKLSCPTCSISFSEISPRLFSFNSPIGACTECNGLGEKLDFDPLLIITEPKNPIRTCTGKIMNLDGTYYSKSLERTAKQHGFTLSTPYNTLTEVQKNILLYGTTTPQTENPFINTNLDDPEYHGVLGPWEGLLTNLRRRYVQTQSEGMRFFFRSYMTAHTCPACQGSRLQLQPRMIRINQLNIYDVCKLSIRDLNTFICDLTLTDQERDISHQIIKEIKERSQFLINVGLDYLSLDRKAGTLSGGEYQRIRLATQIGVGLTGVLYVLDEPSIGLHQRDNLRLIDTLKRLQSLGNTLIVVEHDEDTIKSADYVVDIGPGAGKKGGTITFAGTVDKLITDPNSLTGQYISGKKQIPVPEKRRAFKKQHYITLEEASENNLKHVTVQFPLGKLICVTGVSGSGKSTMVNDILHKSLMRHFYSSKEQPGKHKGLTGLEHLDKVITIDQSPIGRTPRSNPATYSGAFGPIRDLFAQTKEAKIRGYKPGRFSFNVKGGRCESCEGDGSIKIEMHFLSDVFVTCDVCKGKRYNTETLEVTYKGYTISDVLNMTVNQALELFENIPAIKSKLVTLSDVGLGYVHLGQSATTLSGGEAQRIKLAKELCKRSTGKTMYLLDEPTTGLHFEDITKLLEVMNRLVDSGNTMIVIEHNLDVIKTADHIIDLGPEGGQNGGQIIAEGTPEQVAKVSASYTGQFLKKLL